MVISERHIGSSIGSMEHILSSGGMSFIYQLYEVVLISKNGSREVVVMLCLTFLKTQNVNHIYKGIQKKIWVELCRCFSSWSVIYLL